jgi:preprotein translocase subunit SecY
MKLLPSRKLNNSRRQNPASGIVSKVRGLFSNREIMRKLFATLLIIVIYRLLAATPLPGINVNQFQQTFGSSSFSDTTYIFSLFTGGSFDSPSLVGMGIAAYINASIIIQLLQSVIPALERLSKEGERGKEIINRYTRYLTLPLGIFYAVGYVVFLRNADESTAIGQQLSQSGIKALFANLTTNEIILIVATLTAGTMLLMWLAELLTEVGIGNGMSIFISMNIATTLPALFRNDFSNLNISETVNRFFQQGDVSLLTTNAFIYLYLILFGALMLFAGIIVITESTRRVTIMYAKRVRGTESGEESFLPLKLNQSGVVPVIFASSFLTMPQIFIPILVNIGTNMSEGAPLKGFLMSLQNSFLVQNSYDWQYITVYVVLIIIFSFFYSLIIMKPEDIADNLQKSGGFIPGIRPGKSTRDYILRVMIRLTTVGALFLAILAVLPIILGNTIVSDAGVRLALFSGVGGTSLIILVGTALETYRQANSLRISKNYERYI